LTGTFGSTVRIDVLDHLAAVVLLGDDAVGLELVVRVDRRPGPRSGGGADDGPVGEDVAVAVEARPAVRAGDDDAGRVRRLRRGRVRVDADDDAVERRRLPDAERVEETHRPERPLDVLEQLGHDLLPAGAGADQRRDDRVATTPREVVAVLERRADDERESPRGSRECRGSACSPSAST
jgi:hypothetical protein